MSLMTSELSLKLKTGRRRSLQTKNPKLKRLAARLSSFSTRPVIIL